MGNGVCTQTWIPNIGNPYVVRLERRRQCCAKQVTSELFINDVKMERFSLACEKNSCNPYCGTDVSFAWEDHGHRFLLTLNSFPVCTYRYFRLFVDGIDVDTGLGYSAYFRRQGYYYLVIGLIFFLLLGGGLALLFLLENGLSQLWIPINAAVWAFIFGIMGIIAVVKFKNKSTVETNQAAPTSVWPEAYRTTNTDAMIA